MSLEKIQPDRFEQFYPNQPVLCQTSSIKICDNVIERVTATKRTGVLLRQSESKKIKSLFIKNQNFVTSVSGIKTFG